MIMTALSLFSITCIESWIRNYDIFLILFSDDVERNPGPRSNYSESLAICHCNMNRVSAFNYSELFLLKASIAFHKFDIICLSETFQAIT